MGECLNKCISSWRLQAVHFSKTSSPHFACKSTESSSTPHSPSFGSLALLRCVLRTPSQGPSLQSQALKFSINDHLSAGQWCPLPRWLLWKRQEGQQSQQFRTSQLFLMERGQGGNTACPAKKLYRISRITPCHVCLSVPVLGTVPCTRCYTECLYMDSLMQLSPTLSCGCYYYFHL